MRDASHPHKQGKTMNSCIFCLIIDKKISSHIFAETDHVLVIHDVSPKAPLHLLLIPKLHIINMTGITQENLFYIEKMSLLVKEISNQYPDFNLMCNNGAKAGQSVMHLHWHFLSGINLFEKLF